MIIMILRLLDRITMYRLMLYFLVILWVATIILSAAELLSYNPVDIFGTGVVLGLVSYTFNWMLAKLFNTVTNIESAGITALILTLIVGPLRLPDQIGFALLLVGLAMASKYVLVRHQRHLFNPAAIAVLITGLVLGQGATWWVGGLYTFPIILLGGALILTKIKRWQQVLIFLGIYFGYLVIIRQVGIGSLLYSPIWFFAIVMLTEPLTSPTQRNRYLAYGAGIALLLISLQQFFPRYPYAIETSLLIGNLLTHFWLPTVNTRLHLQHKKQIAENVWSFVFKPQIPITFKPGQYLEVSLPHSQPDSRGNRRYFTITSTPDQKNIELASRITEQSSSYKKALMDIQKDQLILASGPYGDFTLPGHPNQPIACMAGGIGITPFISFLSHIHINNLPTSVHLLYFNPNHKDIPYKSTLDSLASDSIAISYVTSQETDDQYKQLIIDKIPDFRNRIFYVSGPPAMVRHYVKILKQLKVNKIKTDYFPGY